MNESGAAIRIDAEGFSAKHLERLSRSRSDKCQQKIPNAKVQTPRPANLNDRRAT
jgi:hypothetical protein